MKKTFLKSLPAAGTLVLLFMVWQTVSFLEVFPKFILPSPIRVVYIFFVDFKVIMRHTSVSLAEGLAGLFIGIIAAFMIAVVMEEFVFLRRAFYPLLLITQTVPPIALAPILVVLMGYGMLPKITLIILVCFFPITIALLGGFGSTPTDSIDLLRSMGATRAQIFIHVKFPSGLPQFFTGLKAAVSYCVVGAVIAEWLGGNAGLGVYMTRVRKSYAFDKMFAAVLWVSIISLVLTRLTAIIEKRAMPYLSGQFTINN